MGLAEGIRFNNESLVAFIKDTKGNKYYVEYLKNDDPESKRYIQIDVKDNLESLDFTVDSWYKIEGNSKIEVFELLRNYSLLISIILFLILTYYLFRKFLNSQLAQGVSRNKKK